MKAEDKCPIDAKLFQFPDCGQVLGPVIPAQLQGNVNPSYSQSPNLPVEGVNWDDAQKFCEA